MNKNKNSLFPVLLFICFNGVCVIKFVVYIYIFIYENILQFHLHINGDERNYQC